MLIRRHEYIYLYNNNIQLRCHLIDDALILPFIFIKDYIKLMVQLILTNSVRPMLAWYIYVLIYLV